MIDRGFGLVADHDVVKGGAAPIKLPMAYVHGPAKALGRACESRLDLAVRGLFQLEPR